MLFWKLIYLWRTQLLYYAVYIFSGYAAIVNNYEISEWQYKFLSIWAECTDYPYITYTKLCVYLGVSEIDIVKFYFDIYGIYNILLLLSDQHVNYNSFLSFICIFAFFPFEPLFQSILSVLFLALLSICSINSHYMIQKDQIITFLRCLGVESSQLDSILEWYNKTVVYIILLYIYCIKL